MPFDDNQLPGLYRAANRASLDSQQAYFLCLLAYLGLLVLAAAVFFGAGNTTGGAIASAVLFLVTLGILIGLRVLNPDDTWYNGRAVAESVKTRSWRWMMRAEPYDDCDNISIVSKSFISDLKSIFAQNRSLAEKLPTDAYMNSPISDTMINLRAMSVSDRLGTYKVDRIQNQADWYSRKALFNKRRSRQWFWASVGLHSLAILLLLTRIAKPTIALPVEVVATAASGVLTWLQAKKHNELASSYSLTAHEIVLIKGEAISILTEEELSQFVVSTEAAFSREHTQWAARRNN
jgi:hypothetical protein